MFVSCLRFTTSSSVFGYRCPVSFFSSFASDQLLPFTWDLPRSHSRSRTPPRDRPGILVRYLVSTATTRAPTGTWNAPCRLRSPASLSSRRCRCWRWSGRRSGHTPAAACPTPSPAAPGCRRTVEGYKFGRWRFDCWHCSDSCCHQGNSPRKVSHCQMQGFSPIERVPQYSHRQCSAAGAPQ